MKTLLEGLFAESEIGVMSYDIFHKYGLDKIKDSLTENYDIKDYDSAKWNEVKSKSVMDSSGSYRSLSPNIKICVVPSVYHV